MDARSLWQRSGDCPRDRKSTRLNSSHSQISYAVFCLKKKKNLTTLLSTFISHVQKQDRTAIYRICHPYIATQRLVFYFRLTDGLSIRSSYKDPCITSR